MSRPTFAENLERLIEAHNLTKADVARRLDVAPSTVTRWTKGGVPKKLSGQDLLRLSRLLGIDPFKLMGSTFEEPGPEQPPPRRGRPPKGKLEAALPDDDD